MKSQQVGLIIFRMVMGLFFVVDGVIKLTGISKSVELFEKFGWGQWFRYFTGSLVLVGGAMIILRLRWTFYGSLLCASSVGTGALLYAFHLHRDPTLPTVITLLTVILAILTRKKAER